MSITNLTAIRDLATSAGLEVEYWGWRGEKEQVAPETLAAVLGALGLPASTDEEIAASALEFDTRPWRRAVPACTTVREGSHSSVFVHVPHGSSVRVEARLEDGSARNLEQLENWVDPKVIDGALVGRATFAVPSDLPTGWHTLVAVVGEDPSAEPAEAGTLIVVPTSTPWPADRSWGLFTQLYQLRSSTSWGIGDLCDLATLTAWGAERSADFVLVNPLNANPPVSPIEPSPYLPTSRQFGDPLILNIDWAAVFVAQRADVPAEAVDLLSRLAGEAIVGNGIDSIDRDRAWALKEPALRALFAAWQSANVIDDEFEDFRRSAGEPLERFGVFCAISRVHGRDARDWPSELATANGSAVLSFAAAHAEDAEFYVWLQCLLEAQARRVQAEAKAGGMSIGVVHDLPVGVHAGGADAWSFGAAMARGVTVGVPADQYNQFGQNWSQPPWRPDMLAELGYAPYRDMLRAVFRNAGAVRIDHILGFFRLWWIPEGNTAKDGCFVRTDAEAMLGILALEAERAGAVVIGEDLGTVPPEARDALAERGMLGASVLWFEWSEDRIPLAAEDYRRACLATVTTHDLPPTAGFLALEHLDVRERLGLLEGSVEQARAEETETISKVVERLRQSGLLGEAPSAEDIVVALHEYLAGSAAQLFGVGVSDLAGDRRGVNQPGTADEYPNWRVPMTDASGQLLTLEQLLASPLAGRIAASSARTA
ncbi:4-alpha-glucanotransferase [Pseudoclavibacter helvolus]|uniref:4-alpha-glucanotransferase n=1 Tax=Pseudoclavibacter helvolus TaxID=255205 RepID=A0A7W4UM93_9MICO|nr:4-alpha-glucanotransferase [Pseudoclavibacter helvolus]